MGLISRVSSRTYRLFFEEEKKKRKNNTKMKLFSLYEHSTGYALLKIENVEEIGALLPMVQESQSDYGKFAGNVKLAAFSPFTSGINALENMNAISEGSVHDDLKVFLENNLPKNMKSATLGVQDSKIVQSLSEQFPELNLRTGEAFQEVCRTTRQHFGKMQKGMSNEMQNAAQRGLAHSYSRAKLRFNVHRQDNMIIQAIAMIDQLDKNINTFAMRVRECYGYHFPEMVKIVNENYPYCRLVKLIGRRENVLEAVHQKEEAEEDAEDPELIKKIEEITMDSAKTQAICDASRKSVGMGISDIDLLNVEHFAQQVVELSEFRRELQEYLRSKMSAVAPNLAALIGDIVGARLISHAGSLTNLAKYPASTVQILGAEKALFRALKKRGNTPKYGLIFHSTFIGRAASKNKGRISRFLANKASIACRMDCFSEEPSNIVGSALKKQVEDRLTFFETGEAPRKNIEVMKEAVENLNASQAETGKDDNDSDASMEDAAAVAKKEAKKKKKKEKKAKKRAAEEMETKEEEVKEEKTEEETVSEEPKKKKKKKSKEVEAEVEADSSEKKKKKKKKKSE